MSPARYDEVASWYAEFADRNGPDIALDWLPATVDGSRILDLACGEGKLARELAKTGATVVAVDISEQLLAVARAREVAEPRGITYVHGDASQSTWWDGKSFDGVTCDMGLSDIDDLQGLATTVATVLDVGGWAVFTLVHPCFPGAGDGKSSWPPEQGYYSEGWWSTGGNGVRGHVGAHHRTLSTYLNTFIDAGLSVQRVFEPQWDERVPFGFGLLLHR